MVTAIGVHDREPLDAVPLWPALGDIGDAAVEEGRFTRKARIDGVGAFVRGAAPVGRLDLEPLPHQLAAELCVIEIASHDKAARAAGLHKAVNDIFGVARLPVGETRSAHLAHIDRADAAGTERRV